MLVQVAGEQALLHNWFYGNYGVRVAAALIFAFLFSSIPLGPVTRWLFAGLDSRLQRTAGAFVPILNALKGFIAVVIVYHGGGEAVGLAAGFAATLGHAYCPWRRFRGGTGIDALAGILLACSPISALIFLALWATCAYGSRSREIGEIFACGLLFLPLWFFLGPLGGFFGIAAGAAVVLRLRLGDEALQRV